MKVSGLCLIITRNGLKAAYVSAVLYRKLRNDMQFYDLCNFMRNKGDKIYEDAKVAVLDEAGRRRYITAIRNVGTQLVFVIPDKPNDYGDGIDMRSFAKTVDELKAANYDGKVIAVEDADFAKEAEPVKGWVDEEDFTVVFDTDFWIMKPNR